MFSTDLKKALTYTYATEASSQSRGTACVCRTAQMTTTKPFALPLLRGCLRDKQEFDGLKSRPDRPEQRMRSIWLHGEV